MAEMFSTNADLSGLLESEQKLHVSTATHKAFIEINEEGAEAAAATGKFSFNKSIIRFFFVLNFVVCARHPQPL